jgi:hypothetical protein
LTDHAFEAVFGPQFGVFHQTIRGFGFYRPPPPRDCALDFLNPSDCNRIKSLLNARYALSKGDLDAKFGCAENVNKSRYQHERLPSLAFTFQRPKPPGEVGSLKPKRLNARPAW